nr:uncharacterized protein LOC112034372 [Quercus suber]
MAFQQLKEYLSRPAIMSSLEVDEVLFSYLAIATSAISFVLIRVENGMQRPVYYVSKSLHEAEVRYLLLEKAILAVGQILADLVAEFTEDPEEIEASPPNMDEKSVVIEKSLRLGFSATNNEAEYEALLNEMAMVKKLGGKAVEIFLDSRLVVGQIRGELEARDTKMQEYLGQVRRMQVNFECFEVAYVPRSENAHADSLATLATSSAKDLPRVIMVENLNTPTLITGDSLQVNQVNSAHSWMDPLLLFLEKDILPEDKSEAEKVRRKAPRFWLFENKKLYKCSFSGPYLLCVHPEALEALLEELHEGICGSHTGGRYSTPAYPQGNGQAEAVNKVIVGGLKKRLDDAKGRWVEELPHVLWTYRTTPRRSTGETPFSMTYGAEAMIPLEVGFLTLRTSTFTSDGNDELLKKNLDLIDERRKNAMVQLAYYQHKLKQGYDANVRLRPLAPGDLVLRKVLGTTKNPTWRKLGPNWEGPYRITSIAGIGAYYLEDLDEKTVLHP